MKELTFDSFDNLALILERIKNEEDSEITIRAGPDSPVFQSPVNKDLISRMAKRWGKKVSVRSEQAEERENPPLSEKVVKKGKSRHRFSSGLKLTLLIAGMFFLFFGGAVAFVYFYLPRATVSLYVEETEVSRQESFTVNPTVTQVDVENLIIPGEVVEVKNSQSREANATGVKLTGEKAAGTVTVANNTTVGISLDSGVKISSGDLNFILQQAVEVPPKTIKVVSAFTEEHIRGTVENVSVVAENIGADYNLPAGTNFTVDDYDPGKVYAIGEADFSGGSTTEVTVISAKDQSQAQEEIAAEIAAKNKDDIKSRLVGDQQLLEESIKDAVLKTQFSSPVGAETKSFMVTVTVSSKAVVFSRSQARELLTALLNRNVPEGFELSLDKTSVRIEFLKVEEPDKLFLSGTIKAMVVPKFNRQEIANSLRGLKPSRAEAVLRGLKGINGYQISLWPRLPYFLQILPHRSNRIKIDLIVRENE
ncbi:hypothetical protein B5M47_01970 [candidate division CPR3 bacterium 4484_211]|uniref:Baseplate protein J-like domain-containing protein n=1 Tax=candidate division CPR3 bacterium 4484_211 TaxID=1968527 RepID=A0A1W9NY80_UNCC3|nr:MAG: hypothetical protein B5M47_01970 [candidate division CPR3 bacterium 4484_211]